VEAAAAGRLPGLVRLQDIRGDLHCHTRASDGQHTVDALAAAAAARGWQYLAITDHSRSARVAGGLTAEEARAHADRVRTAARRHPGLTLLAGTECDILPDGSLDYPDTVLARLDLVVAAVHSHFTQSRAEMTQRICRALAHPRVHLLAHPTGRLLGQREPYEVDLDEVLRVAARHGKAVEVNAQADRLDLDGVHCRRARGLGVLLAVDTDAHVLDHFAWMELGVATARRGWVEASQVVNTWPLPRLLAWTRRPAAGEGEARRVAGRGRRR
jgi:DNA polymerase (family 10)